MPPVLKVENLTTEIKLKYTILRAVDDLTFQINPGETLGIVGESGSGKTMAAMSIIGLLPPGASIVKGSVFLNGRDVTKASERELQGLRGKDIGTVFQNPMTSLNPSKTIGWQIAESLIIHKLASQKDARARALEVLSLVGIADPKRRIEDYPHQLSGGMRQRVMIAIALACEPKLLIADEPTTALDVTVQAQILTLLEDLKARLGMALLLVTHDLGVIAGHADRVLVMYGGKSREEAKANDLFTTMRHPYTQALLSSIPRVDQNKTRYLPVIPGLPPDLSSSDPGCKFAPRCNQRSNMCLESEPPVASLNNGHLYSCFHPILGPAQPTFADDDLAHFEEPENFGEPIISVSKASKSYIVRSGVTQRKLGEVQAVHGVSLEVKTGETLGIVGESGCGKSTLAKVLVGLETANEGQIKIAGVEISKLKSKELRVQRRDFQMMFQDPYSSFDPRMQIGDSIAEPLFVQGIGNKDEREAKVREILKDVGLLESSLTRYPHELSGGQLQRVGFARTLILSPKVVVADEPVSALDVSVRSQILNLMRSLQEKHGLTYVLISHDLSVIKFLADRVAVMYLGEVVEMGYTENVFTFSSHPYTRALLDSVPTPDPTLARRKGLTPIRGELPSALEPPTGCYFRTRCPFVLEACEHEKPAFTEVDTDHYVKCLRSKELFIQAHVDKNKR